MEATMYRAEATDDFKRTVIVKMREINTPPRQRLIVRAGLIFHGGAIQSHVESVLGASSQGIGDGDIDWVAIIEKIIELIALFMELFGGLDSGSDVHRLAALTGQFPVVKRTGRDYPSMQDSK